MKPASLSLVPGLAATLAKLRATLPQETAEEVAAREQRAAEREREAAARERLAVREAILRDRGIPAKHRALILGGGLDETPPLERTRTWLADDRLVLTLVGPGDAGKTTAASWAAAQEPSAADLRNWTPRIGLPTVVFIPAEFLVGAWHAHKVHYHMVNKVVVATPERDPITRRTMADLLDCWLLVIDDLGQEAAVVSDMVGAAVDTLVRRRSDAGYRTLITSNLATSAEMESRYIGRGTRLHESLLEYGYFTPVKALGYRRRRST